MKFDREIICKSLLLCYCCRHHGVVLGQYLQKYVIKKTNQIALLSTKGDPIHCVITSQTKYSEPGPIMDDITFRRDMLIARFGLFF